MAKDKDTPTPEEEPGVLSEEDLDIVAGGMGPEIHGILGEAL